MWQLANIINYAYVVYIIYALSSSQVINTSVISRKYSTESVTIIEYTFKVKLFVKNLSWWSDQFFEKMSLTNSNAISLFVQAEYVRLLLYKAAIDGQQPQADVTYSLSCPVIQFRE